MAFVNLTVNGRLYEIGCEDGQADQVRALGREVDERVQQLSLQLGTQPEGRLLVMAGLMLADDLASARAELAEALATLDKVRHDLAAATAADVRVADSIDHLAERVVGIAELMERS